MDGKMDVPPLNSMKISLSVKPVQGTITWAQNLSFIPHKSNAALKKMPEAFGVDQEHPSTVQEANQHLNQAQYPIFWTPVGFVLLAPAPQASSLS